MLQFQQHLTGRAGSVAALCALLAVVALVTSLEVGRSSVFGWLEYQRNAILQGQLWRLLTGHFVHLTPWHLVMNLASLLMVWSCFLRRWTALQFLGVVFVAPLLISSLFLMTDQRLTGYAGLSGVIYTLLIAGLVCGWRREPGLRSVLLLMAVLRLGWEQSSLYNPDYLDSWLNGPVYPNAHLFGALVGGLLAFAVRTDKPRTRRCYDLSCSEQLTTHYSERERSGHAVD